LLAALDVCTGLNHLQRVKVLPLLFASLGLYLWPGTGRADIFAPSNDAQELATVQIETNPGLAIPPTFMGLSHEWGAQKMMGDAETGVNRLYRQLLANLAAYGSGPIYLRIGGNSTDGTGEPTAETVRPFAELAKDQKVIFSLGVNLGSGDVNLATAQAKAYLSAMPPGSVNAIEIGNEPDHYNKNGKKVNYTPEQYFADFDQWKAAIMPLLPPGTKLMGQTWGGVQKNDELFVSREGKDLGVFSVHYYAGGPNPPPPPDYLLTPRAATHGPERIAPDVAAAHRQGVEFRMGEMNSIFHGGLTGMSNAFQSALWAVDVMFEFAKEGVDGVNWHGGGTSTGKPASGGYSPFVFSLVSSNGRNTYTAASVRPLYYGFLFFQAATGKGAHFLPATLNTKANLKAWATIDAAGVPRLVLINKDENMTGTVAVTMEGFRHASVLRLQAPSYAATEDITFGGQTFDGSPDGKLRGTPVVETITDTNGVFQVPMPITSAALVTFSK
jgi:hypothetical protein